jgi:hypothetical protein
VKLIKQWITAANAGYQDFMMTYIANGTQADTTSPGICTVIATYTDASMTLSGTWTCTGLEANLTMAHIHYCPDYDITEENCPSTLLTDCPLTVGADGTSGSFNCVFKDYTSMDAICGDNCYWNFHTDAYPSGEVRSNIVNTAPMCNVKGGIVIDGTVTSIGSAPTTGIQIADFYVGFFATAATGTGGGYIIISWHNQTLIISGCFYGITSAVDSIYFNYPGDYTDFIDLSPFYSIPIGYPFTFHYVPSTAWDMGKLTSGMTQVAVNTASNNGELTVSITSSGFPASAASCAPYTITAPTTALTCYYTDGVIADYSYTCTNVGDVCGITSAGVKGCITPVDVCYSCTCNVVSPTGFTGYACCNTNNCNVGTFSALGCGSSPPSGAV